MSLERLDRVLDELIATADGRADLQEWVMQPIDGGLLDMMQEQAAPWQYPAELVHVARRIGFLPGLYGWSRWAELEDHPKLPAPDPGRLAWERTVQEIFQEEAPGRDPLVHWAMIGSDPDRQYECVVPLLPQPWDHAPICFSNSLDSVDVVSPSLTAFLESFLVCVKAVSDLFGGTVEFPDFEVYFDYFWWQSIHGLYIYDPDLKAAIEGPLARINAADQSAHPVWRRLGGPDEVMFNDGRLLWPES